MHEFEMKVQADGAELSGTLCLPEQAGRLPAVLMIHGSGPLDRNENMKGQNLDVFNSIATTLAQNGIASFRYDKRGCGSSSGDYMSAGHYDLVKDAISCFDALSAAENVDQNSLYILGHSEGCIIAPQVSQKRSSVTGLILLCPFIEPVDSALMRQASQLALDIKSMSGLKGVFLRMLIRILGNPVVSQEQLIKKIVSTEAPVMRKGLSRLPAKWLRELLALDLASIFASTHTPMFLIGGEKDLQCDPQDIFRIAEVSPAASETLLVRNMNHLLRIETDKSSLMGSIKTTQNPIAKEVLESAIRWIREMEAKYDR